jgi:hypothetical protein
MSEKKKQITASVIDGMSRPALVFDMATFDQMMKLMDVRPRKPEPEPFRVFCQSNHFAIPVIRSPYLGGYVEDRPSIIHDFDRWFRRAQSRAEQKIFDARWEHEEKSRREFESCWRE